MLEKIVTTESVVLFLNPDKIIKMVPCGNGDYNVFMEGENDGESRITFTISGREAEKLAGDRVIG